MRYPKHNPTMLDTGIRMLDIVSLYGKDTEAAGGDHAVYIARLTRRADAITTEGDIWETDGPEAYLTAGKVNDCIAYIAAQTPSAIMYDGIGRTIYRDTEKQMEYLDALRPLCDDGETLGLMLNYAAAVKYGYAPNDPEYNPAKKPIV